MNIVLPKIKKAEKISSKKRRLLIAAYGFEDRSLGWTSFQKENEILDSALLIKYENPKGRNKIGELKKNLKRIGVRNIWELKYDVSSFENIEDIIEAEINKAVGEFEEIILDVTAMTKFIILLFLCKLDLYSGELRIVYSEAEEYAPSLDEYNNAKEKIKKVINFPSKGFGTILRAKCLSSIRMQGQPVTLVAFTSFNEQLVRHMLGTLSPHRLLFINGRPPRKEFKWREHATISLHKKLISEYPIGNKIELSGELNRTCSTLDYEETIKIIDGIYDDFNLYERIIIAATGSKMQTVGLFFSKMKHPDIHIEYPTPDSYYIKGFTTGLHNVHEIYFENFNLFISKLSSK